MANNERAAKMADRIKEIIARRLEKGIKDPRLGFVTVTDVRMTGDLQHATIFYTVYGTDEERADSAKALKSATGMLRSEVGRNITSRLTPVIEFQADAIPENAALIEGLLREAQERDAAVEALAKTAEYAGDEDPYVKPRDFDDDEDDDDDDDEDEDDLDEDEDDDDEDDDEDEDEDEDDDDDDDDDEEEDLDDAPSTR